MNYGYAYNRESMDKLEIEEGDKENRYCIQLYDRVGGRKMLLENKKVLEVGCGRGGGASYLTRYFNPKFYIGVDISKNVIHFCERVHESENLTFIQGEAEDIPIKDETVDTVINIESSRCYRDKDMFLREVNRVLKPEGNLLFADMREPDAIAELENQFKKNGFKIVEKEDITGGVIRALEKDHSRRVSMIERLTPFILRRAVPDFAGVKDSNRYNSFVDGTMLYLRYLVKKVA